MNAPSIVSNQEPESGPRTGTARKGFLAGDALIAGVTLSLYAPILGRGFVSEDFVILRTLDGYGLRELAREFTGPWLGALDFYRPVSTLILLSFWSLVGASPLAFDVLHLAVHVICALLVRRLVGSRCGSTAGVGAGLLFALFPLHPNTVSFLASFATLYSTGFALCALRAFDTGRVSSGFVAMAAALWSYEGAVGAVVSGSLLVLFEGRDTWKEPRRRRIALGLLGLLTAYLLVRAGALGVSVGGYDSFRGRFSMEGLGVLLADAAHALPILFAPGLSGRVGGFVVGLALFAVLALSLRLAGEASSDRPASTVRVALLCLTGLGLALAPFAFVRIVPATGRYAYFASFWSSMLLAAFLLGPRGRSRVRPIEGVLAAVFLTLVASEALALSRMVDVYRQAAITVRTAHARLEREIEGLRPEETVFVSGLPPFVYAADGTPIAQAHHWGLSDRFLPPFRTAPRSLVSLPSLSAEELAPLLAAGATVLSDSGDSARISRLEPSTPLVRRLSVSGPEGDIPARGGLRIAWGVEPGRRYRVIVLSQALSLILSGDATPGQVLVSESVLRQVAVLYDGRIWYWVLSQDTSGGLLSSEMRPVRVVLPGA